MSPGIYRTWEKNCQTRISRKIKSKKWGKYGLRNTALMLTYSMVTWVIQSQGFPEKRCYEQDRWLSFLILYTIHQNLCISVKMKTYTATPNGPANGKFQKKAVDSTGLPETSFSTPRNRLCTHIQCQCGRWLASASPVGCLSSNRDSWMRSFPLPDLL